MKHRTDEHVVCKVRWSRNKHWLRPISTPKHATWVAFLKEIPEPFENCNKNMLQQSAGSKWAQVERKMQKAFKDCALLSYKANDCWFFKKLGTCRCPFFFFCKTTSTLEVQFKRISDSSVCRNAQGVCCNITKTV